MNRLCYANLALLNQLIYFVFSLIICYWLFKCGVLRVMCVCVCVCVRNVYVCVCVCVCVCEREREQPQL